MLSDVLLRATRPMATFRGLELDVVDQQRQADFWRVALGGVVQCDGGLPRRIGPGPGRPAREILRLRPANEPAPGDARVHVDVRLPGPDPEHLLEAGARLVREPVDDPWFVLADPEDNEFCAFPAVDERPPGVFELVVKCRDPHGLADWWATVIGGEVTAEGEAAAITGAAEFPWDYMVFDPVPEPLPAGRMRWHLDLRDRDPGALVALGATVIAHPDLDHRGWTLADPDGNQFFARSSAQAFGVDLRQDRVRG
jgi:hypothetical protein